MGWEGAYYCWLNFFLWVAFGFGSNRFAPGYCKGTSVKFGPQDEHKLVWVAI